MRKNYIVPQTQAQIISVSQLMAAVSPTDMGINYNPISGSEEEGVIFGD